MFSIFTKKSRTNKNKTIKKFNKLNCSPLVRGSSANSNTCYTTKILFEIRNAYNSNDLNKNKITSNNPDEVWRELRNNLVECKIESCWLKELKDKKLISKIKKYVFAPVKPPEWKKNPNEWLSNIDLLEVMTHYERLYHEFEFIGPTCIDFDDKLPEENGKCVWEELCKFDLKEQIKRNKKKIGIIFNLDKHYESGSHWVSLFVDIENKFIFFFDSVGSKIPNEIQKLVDRIKLQGKTMKPEINFKFIQNHPNKHQSSNTECGMYSLFFIITMLTHETEFHKYNNHDEVIKLFKQKYIPDKFVEKYRNVYFNNVV